MNKSVGVLFREIVIDPRLRDLVNEILAAEGDNDPIIPDAVKRIARLASSAAYYLFASEIRGYLEEKTRVGTEPRVFPIAGDLFLDALEENLASVGPNLFKDHYSGMLGCYREGNQVAKTVEGPLYCVDLAVHRTITLFLTRNSRGTDTQDLTLSFQNAESRDWAEFIGQFLRLAKQAQRDAIAGAARLDRSAVPRSFIEFVIDEKDRLDKVVSRWEAFQKDPALLDLSAEAYLLRGLEEARPLDYPPLTAIIKEQLGILYEETGRNEPKEGGPGEAVLAFYDAGFTHLEHGNAARESEAYNLALRRYRKSATLFNRIHDRTSRAKALVEEARAHIKKGHDPEAVRQSLYEAVQLVMAHIRNLPHGNLPTPKDPAVIKFLDSKGYHIEADAYAAATRGKR